MGRFHGPGVAMTFTDVSLAKAESQSQSKLGRMLVPRRKRKQVGEELSDFSKKINIL